MNDYADVGVFCARLIRLEITWCCKVPRLAKEVRSGTSEKDSDRLKCS
jgi:hypothetical protein